MSQISDEMKTEKPQKTGIASVLNIKKLGVVGAIGAAIACLICLAPAVLLVGLSGGAFAFAITIFSATQGYVVTALVALSFAAAIAFWLRSKRSC